METPPLWISIVIVVFLLAGASLTLLGAIGLVCFQSFYERLHMPTLGTSWGVGAIIIASVLYSYFVDLHVIVHELLLTAFIVVTAPVTLMMLSRAALHRDLSDDWRKIPRALLPHHPEDKTNNNTENDQDAALKANRAKSID